MAKAINGLRALIGEMLAEQLSELLSGDAATTIPAVRAERDTTDVEPTREPASEPTRRRRTRRPAPAVGYHVNVDKRTAKRAINETLAHNPGVVLEYVMAHPGSTNRQITAGLGEAVGGKKAVESALDQLRTTDADGNRLERGSTKQKRNALVISKPLE